jgi:hypothetical protein
MISKEYTKYSVYKGLQRPITFKGLKGVFIYYGFGLAAFSLLVLFLVNLFQNFLTGALSMVLVLVAGIVSMAMYQRKYGLYRKNIAKGIYVINSVINRR